MLLSHFHDRSRDAPHGSARGRAPGGCDNFLYRFKGAPSARHVRAKARTQGRGREVIERECASETDTTTRTTSGGAVGHCPPFGRRPCRALSRGGADGHAAAGSAGPLPQVGGTRRYAASMHAAAKSGRGPSSVPGILSPRKITVKGAPACGLRVPCFARADP